jgi:hypothetical protein
MEALIHRHCILHYTPLAILLIHLPHSPLTFHQYPQVQARPFNQLPCPLHHLLFYLPLPHLQPLCLHLPMHQARFHPLLLLRSPHSHQVHIQRLVHPPVQPSLPSLHRHMNQHLFRQQRHPICLLRCLFLIQLLFQYLCPPLHPSLHPPQHPVWSPSPHLLQCLTLYQVQLHPLHHLHLLHNLPPYRLPISHPLFQVACLPCQRHLTPSPPYHLIQHMLPPTPPPQMPHVL